MFPGDGSSPGNHLTEERVERRLDLLGAFALLFLGDHDVHMDVAVAGMAEAGDREAGLFLKLLCEGDQVDESAAGNGNVLVELGKSCGLQGSRERATQGPDPLAALRGGGEFDFQCLVLG